MRFFNFIKNNSPTQNKLSQFTIYKEQLQMSTFYNVHHKIFNLQDFYAKSANFTEPSGIELKIALDCGEYSGFSVYEITSGTIEDLKTYLDNKYGATSHNVIYQIYPDTSAGCLTFQTISALKQKATDAA